ncbi:ethD domain-containing protein [Sarocladium implicatum]|nr:ethD domain-containing protein [Sarocladium implicatum]
MKLLPRTLPVAQTGFQLLMLSRRRQDLTPAQFKDHYENVHVPLLKNLTGDTFPESFVRHYIKRDHDPDAPKLPSCEAHGDGNLEWPAALLMGEQSDIVIDAVAVLTYRDKEHFESNWAFFKDEEFVKIITEDEAKFSEWAKGVLLQ